MRQVLNADDITDRFISYFINTDGGWTIQGNELARWSVERSEA